MGTSSAFRGANGNTPLVPSWVDDADAGGTSAPTSGGPDAPDGDGMDGGDAGVEQPSPPDRPPIPSPAAPDRFTAPRSNFTRFARSGGSDRASMGRAVSGYVGTSAGGARRATQRMGSSRRAGAGLVSFLGNAAANGVATALRTLNLDSLVGRPIEQVFTGLADYVCPDGGSIDEGIARDAFVETIADLAEAGITDIDGLTADQIQTVFELYVTHTIEARICNDIGSRVVTVPSDPTAAARVEAQLREFIQRGVSDAIVAASADIGVLSQDAVSGFVNGVYETAFEILQTMGDREANQ